VLAAAERLFASKDPRTVTMDDIAKEAGVGRGTLYRRYPDRMSIATALLDQHERALQEKLMGGEPPLGPGAPPAERLTAFYAAMVDLLEQHVHLVLGAEEGEARFATGAYGFWRAHVRALLLDAHMNPDTLAEPLLAPLAAEVFRFQRRTLSPEQIADGLAEIASRVLSISGEVSRPDG
jgi:AcrR family transcriptional regulator